MSEFLTKTPLELFDYCSQKIVEQNARSTNGRMCLYRGPNGLKCGAGFVITDEQYNPKMETKVFSIVNTDYNLGFSPAQVYAIREVQRIHDAILDITKWPEAILKERQRLATIPTQTNSQ